MEPVLLGYFAKSVTRNLKAPGVEEVCSVSGCVSSPPSGWVDLWRHNDFGVYDSERLAESVVHDAFQILVEPDPASKPPWKVTLRQEPFPNGQLFAYKMFPTLFGVEGPEDLPVDGSKVEPLSEPFEKLGYDVVERAGGCVLGFGCSPLSCNGRAFDLAVNRHCLFDDPAEALRRAEEFGRSHGRVAEPGPYVVIEVWRRRGPVLDREACAASAQPIDPNLIRHAVKGPLANAKSASSSPDQPAVEARG